MSQTKYSISAAARIVGVSRATISRHMKSGKLSYEVDSDGAKKIDGSELARVYPQDCDFEREEKRGGTTETHRSESPPGPDLAAFKEIQDRLTQQYRDQIDHLKEALDKAQTSQDRITLLLERQTTEGSSWQASLEAMSEKLANETEQRIKKLQENHDREITQVKRALHAERNKPLWKKLFG